ncbi:hypothetical protein MPS_3837 [Mycobacterium pseudoshottsii JCM 15466]|nr:hypothetical protein MPS_3837 [Mycobacterium pseudoshottsii JCM 15466]
MVLVAGDRPRCEQPVLPITTERMSIATVTMSLKFIYTTLRSGFAA